jgi:F-type H+-transporting ATPase subunit b
MEGIIHAFAIDWRLLLIQAVNFGLLLLILWHFLYKPLMRMLDERRIKIEGGVRQAEAAEHKLKEIESERVGIITTASREGEGIVERARKTASDKERSLLSDAEERAASLLKSAEREAQELKTKALDESKAEMAKLVVLGAERVIREGK